MTYNVHSCRGTDGVIAPRRIAEVIKHWSPDVVALQEVQRSDQASRDQVALLAAETGMDAHFTKTRPDVDDAFGIATLVRHSFAVHAEAPLPTRRGEPRAAHWLRVDTGETTIDVVNTHLSIHLVERIRQLQALLRQTHASAGGGPPEPAFSLWPLSPSLVLCGDFNAGFISAEYRLLCVHLQNAQRAVRRWPRPTFPAQYPVLGLDHVWLGSAWKVVAAQVSATKLERRASDHLPLVVDIVRREVPLQVPSQEHVPVSVEGFDPTASEHVASGQSVLEPTHSEPRGQTSERVSRRSADV
jgi:endonuclease/exonuclease/phosphatase family metal-dependent hydrolase